MCQAYCYRHAGAQRSIARQWVKEQQACLNNAGSHLYQSLPSLLKGGSVRHMSWVWDVFSHIHDIEAWVMWEVLANSPMGLDLKTQAETGLSRAHLVSAGLKADEADAYNIFDLPSSCSLRVHAEVQQLFYLQQHPPCRYPYIGISFPPCRHCALMLSRIPINYRGQAVLCQHRGCSGNLYSSWTAGDYMTDEVVTAFLGPHFTGLPVLSQPFQWASSEQSTVAKQIHSPVGSAHAVDDMSRLALCLVMEELKSVKKWLEDQGAARMVEGSLSQQ